MTKIQIQRMALESQLKTIERNLKNEVIDMKLLAERDLQYGIVSTTWYMEGARKMSELVARRDSTKKLLEFVSEEFIAYVTQE